MAARARIAREAGEAEAGIFDAHLLLLDDADTSQVAPPEVWASMQAVAGRHGHSTLAFLLVPIIGAFLIDITNALVIQGFLALPYFGF